ncbi:hypothetical protein BJ165DRAFT_1071774 [Panaeolus papilionaceus]|nr:hypothetical protein BJ165DRAFT_1071774 [Panaeolus papilionaceus]
MHIIPTMTTQRVVVLLCHGSAFITTVLRLIHRSHIRRLWWDDFWAFCAMICSVVSIFLFLIMAPTRHIAGSGLAVSVSNSIMTAILVFYLAALWFARISIAVTIVRLLNDGTKFKSTAKCVSILFGLSATLLIILRIVNCGTKVDRPPVCQTPLYVARLDLTMDIAADIWLIIAPLVMLCRTNLSQQHRRLISGIFACGTLITVTSVLHIVFLMSNESIMTALTAHVQAGAAVVVCNLLVLVTYVYRKWGPQEVAPTLEPPKLPDVSGSIPTTEPSSMRSVIPTFPKLPLVTAPSRSSPQETRRVRSDSSSSHFSLTELGSSMLGGSSRDLSSFGVPTTTSRATRASNDGE